MICQLDMNQWWASRNLYIDEAQFLARKASKVDQSELLSIAISPHCREQNNKSRRKQAHPHTGIGALGLLECKLQCILLVSYQLTRFGLEPTCNLLVVDVVSGTTRDGNFNFIIIHHKSCISVTRQDHIAVFSLNKILHRTSRFPS